MQGTRAEVVDYDEVRHNVETAMAAGDLAKVKEKVESLLDHDDRTRSASENLFVYRTLGTLYSEVGMDEESNEAFVRAYAYDSRDRDVLEALAGLVLRGQGGDESLPILNRLLVHHRYALRSSFVARVYKAIADVYQERGELEKARIAYEKALEARPGDMDIINALLGIAEESGDDEAVLEVRERLLTTLTNAESRAAVLVAIGDDYVKKFSDTNRAIDAYERALVECSTSQPALLRVADLSIRNEDWMRAVRSLTTLGEVSDEPEKQVKYLTKAGVIYRDKLNELTRSIQTYNKVLDIDATEVDAFKAVARMLVEMEDWEALEENYERMLERQNALASKQPSVLTVLYRNLGELRLERLENVKSAAEAYQAASDLLPDDLALHEILADLYARNDDTAHLAIQEHREILRLAPDRLESVDALAGLYRRLERFDESLCVFRVLDALGRADEEGGRIVERYSTHRAPKIEGVFDEDIWNEYIRPDYLDQSLLEIFRLAQPALIELFAHDLEHYELREKEARFDLEEPSFFSRIYTAVVESLNLGSVPGVYVNPKMQGMRNGYLFPPAFLVGQDLLAGREEREIAFVAAKAVTLFRPEFFLTQFGGHSVLQGVLYTIFKTFKPDLNIQMDKNMQRISRDLEKRLQLDVQNHLKELVAGRIEEGGDLNVKLFIEAAEDTANRVGLIFCDDPNTARNLLEEEDNSLGGRGVGERFGSLLMWALSDQYMDLRKKLSLDIDAS